MGNQKRKLAHKDGNTTTITHKKVIMLEVKSESRAMELREETAELTAEMLTEQPFRRL